MSIEYGWLFYEIFGREDEALSWARTGLRLFPEVTEDPETLVLRGSGQSIVAHCIRQSDPDSSVEAARLGLQHVEKALAKNPESGVTQSAYREAIDLYLFLGQADDAIRCCKSYLQLEPSERERSHCMLLLGSALRCTDELAGASRVLQDLQEQLGADKTLLPRISYELGLVELARSRFNEAREHLRSAGDALRAHPTLGKDNIPVFEMTEINVNLAEACYELGHYHEAVWACEQVIAVGGTAGPRYWNALLRLGWCHLRMDSNSQARSFFERVLGSIQAAAEERQWATDGLKELGWGLAESFYNSGEFSKAASEYEALLPLYTDDDEDRSRVLLWVANCQMSLGAWEQARQCYQAVLASHGATKEQKRLATNGLAAAHWKLAESFWKSGEYSKAASECDALLALLAEDDEHHCRVLLSLGHCRMALGEHNAAKECYQALLASRVATEEQKELAKEALLGEGRQLPQFLKKWLQ